MFSSLTLAAALFVAGAPAPKGDSTEPGAPLAINGPAPRFVEIKPDADGKIKLAVSKPGNLQGGGIAVAIGGINGGPNPPQNVVIRNFGGLTEQVELAKLKDLTITTPSGKEISVEAAQKALAKGGLVVVSTDGKKVSPAYLRLFKEDVLVLVSPDLIQMGGFNGFGGFGGGNVPAILPLPPVPAPIPVPEAK
ncbi:MAG: hypothetical protein K8T89_01015 [Planctomycetes bacterium]|nr:hypothetical protein [Planctomycetota bacterium]